MSRPLFVAIFTTSREHANRQAPTWPHVPGSALIECLIGLNQGSGFCSNEHNVSSLAC